MAKKKSSIDFKQILMQKGERYGLYVAGAFLLLFVFLGGMQAINSKSSASIVKDFDAGMKSVEQKIAQGNEQPAAIQGVVYGDSTVANIQFNKYVVRNSLYNISTNELTRRMNPILLPPNDAQVDFVRGSVGVYVITEINGKRFISVIREKVKAAADTRKITNLVKRGAPKGAQTQPTPTGQTPVPAPPGGLGMRPGVPGAPGGMANGGVSDPNVEVKDISDKDIDQARPAENISPQRMVVVTLPIPYKQQVEIYRKALRAQKADELTDFPEYRGFVVERRTFSLDGKTVEQDWAPLDMQTTLGELFSKTIEYEPETPPREMKRELQTLYPRILPPDEFKLLVPRPKLYRGEYPPVNLPSVNRALEALAASGTSATDVRTQTEMRIGEEDIFRRRPDDVQPGGGGPGRGAAGPGGPRPGIRMIQPPAAQIGGNQQAVRAEDEEAWLMRFIDLTAVAGHAFQYRVRLQALNPNYRKPPKELATPSLADKEYLQSDWYEIPILVVAPPEEFLYAAAKDDRRRVNTEKMPSPGQWDDTWVQMQKWYPTIRPQEYPVSMPFGEWLVADIKAIRGQYVGDAVSLMLPMWHLERGMFLLRENAKKKPTGPSIVPGAPRTGEPTWTVDLAPTPPVLMVDFEGGSGNYYGPKNRQVFDTSGVEMLFMTADGKLHVARSGQDMNDADRVKRDEGYKKWVESVRQDTIADVNRGAGDGRRAPGP